MIRFDDISPEIMQSMCTPLNQILPPISGTGGLYIGAMSALSEPELLNELKITHLVQVLDVPWLPQSEHEGFECYRIDLLDDASSDLQSYLEHACQHIDQAMQSGGNVLVHCQQGVSRSASIVIAFLIATKGMTYDSAHAFCKKRRACIKPNSGFVKTLQEWEQFCISKRPNVVRRFTS